MKKMVFEDGRFLFSRRSLLLLTVFTLATLAIIAAPMPIAFLQGSSQDAGIVLEKKEDFNPPVKITRTKSKVGNTEPGSNTATHSVQQRERSIKKKSWSNEPISLEELKVKGVVRGFGQKFSEDNDWFRNLNIKIKNKTSKNIIFAKVLLVFQSSESNDVGVTPPLAHEITFGRDYRLPKRNTLNKPSISIKPNDTTNLALSDSAYGEVSHSLKSLKYLTGVKDIEIIVGQVAFDDGTLWYAGNWFVPDANSSDGYKLIEPLVSSSTKNGAATRFGRLNYEGFDLPSNTFTKVTWITNHKSLSATQNSCPAPPGCGFVRPPNRFTCVSGVPNADAGPNCMQDSARVEFPTFPGTLVATSSKTIVVTGTCRDIITGEACLLQPTNIAVVCDDYCVDEDGDGYGQCCAQGRDCRDDRADINPGKPEICGDGFDNNCVGGIDEGCPTPTPCPPVGSPPASNYRWDTTQCRWVVICQPNGNPPYGCNGATWNVQTCQWQCGGGSCPILVDVTGTGLSLTDAASGVMFDIDGDGVATHLSWTSPGSDNAWLALDRNGNGTIDNGTELFGNSTPQPEPPVGEERQGFRALAEYDKAANGGSGDGAINEQDAIFSSLRFWQDTNHNGISETAELKTLPALGVARLDLDYSESRRTDEHGNHYRYRAKVWDANGKKIGRWAWDVFLVSGQ